MDKQDVVKHFEEMTESKTWTRRSLLSWLGKGCVLALGSRGVAACHGLTGPNGSGRWVGCDGVGFGFNPGANATTPDWGQRTVDPQGLDSILANWDLSVDGLVDK